MSQEEKYITSDLYLTAYLKVKGHKFSVEKIRTKSNFVFKCDEKILSDVNDYYNFTNRNKQKILAIILKFLMIKFMNFFIFYVVCYI